MNPRATFDALGLWKGNRRVRSLALAGMLLLPLLAATAVYQPFLHQWFVSDDFIWLEAASNPKFPSFVKGALSPGGPTPYWRPLVDFYFFSMYRVFSLNGNAYHVASLLLHGVVAAGTVLIARRVTRSFATGLLAGMLFAVSPAYGVAVTWVSSTTELMFALLSLAAILLYLRYLDTDNVIAMALALCTSGAAMLAHESAGAIPAILIVLSLALRTPKSGARGELQRVGRSLLPFIIMGVVFAIGQVSRLYVGSKGGTLDAHVISRLISRLRWLSLPLSSSHGSWLHAGQWALLLVFTFIACIGLLRRSWELPALFACTVLALLPSCFLTLTFDPRWTYLASVFWAGFIAMLIALPVRWLGSCNGLVSAATLVVVLGGLAYFFIPQTRDAQRGLATTAAQMEQMSQAIQTECPLLGPGRTAVLYPPPLFGGDTGYRVSSLVRLLRRGTKVVVASGNNSPHPAAGDCVISWSYLLFQVKEAGAGP